MKKLLALVLTLAMVLGTFSFAAAAPADVVGTDCEDAVARLGALGIIAGFPDGTYRPEESVTRAQFAKIVVAALGVGEAAQYAAGTTKFTDVPADHWAAGYINVAVDVGVISGYPDGTFKPENPVTFAEAIKMIVAALGYTPKAEALGGYPGGYLAVAAEEEITDGVNVVGNMAANRGAIAIMVDNSLEVPLMEQVSYGDKPTWEVKEDKTLLKTKLGVKEVEGTVTEISRVAKLAENKFKLDDGVTYELVVDVNTESLFLKEVKLLHKDKKVVWVSVETAASDILFDTVVADDGIDPAKKVYLKVADKSYAWFNDKIDDATIYVNYEKVEPDDAKDLVGMYGYFIFDGKEVKYANLFDFEGGDKGFVTGVAKDEIEYISLYDADEQVLELDDYDEVYVYNKDFTKASLDDIDENSVIFYWANDDDELFVMVVNEKVTGEVTRVRDDSAKVTIDGKNYTRAKDESIASLNSGEDFDTWANTTITDVIDEEVALYFDLNGEIAAMVTDAQATSDDLYGVVTYYYEGRNPKVAIFTSEGKEVEYYFEKNTDADVVNDANGDDIYYAVTYKLNSDGEIAKGSLKLIGDVDGVESANITKEADKKYVLHDGTTTFYINSDTVLIKLYDKDGDDVVFDPELVKYDSLVSMSISSATPAIVIGTPGKTAKMIVFEDPDFKGSKKDVYFGVVTDRPWKSGSNWYAQIDVFGSGKADYKLPASNTVAKGNLVAFYLDNNDKVDKTTSSSVVVFGSGTVGDRSGSYLTVSGYVYRVASNVVLYKLDDGALDGTTRLTKINAGDEIEFMYDVEEREIVAAKVTHK